jgi:rhodanese-related sulfurtransferase
VLVYELRARAQSSAAVSATEAVRLINHGAVLIDVRSAADFKAGHIGGARNIPGNEIVDGAKSMEKFRDKTVITCCETGATSASAARELVRQGFKNVLNLRGGLSAWRQDNLPVVKD